MTTSFVLNRSLLAGVAALLIGTSAANGGITLVSHQRGVGAGSTHPTPLTDTADDFGLFIAATRYADPVTGDTAAAARQRSEASTTPDGGGIFSGTGRIEVSDLPGQRSDARALYHVTFDLEGPDLFYQFNYRLAAGTTAPNPTPGDVATLKLIQRDKVSSYSGVTLVDQYPNVADSRVVDISDSGVLNAGRYQLIFEAGNVGGQGDEGGVSFVDYQFELVFSDEPVAVPLPPAVWSGLVLLGGLAIVRCRAGLRRAAA